MKDFSNKVIALKPTEVSLHFNTKMPGERVSKNFIELVYLNSYKGKSEGKEIADMFSNILQYTTITILLLFLSAYNLFRKPNLFVILFTRLFAILLTTFL